MRSTFVASLIAAGGFLAVAVVSHPLRANEYFHAQEPTPAAAPALPPESPPAMHKLPPIEADYGSNACDTCFSDAGHRWRPYAGVAATFLSANTLGSSNSVTIVNVPAGTVNTVSLDAQNSGLEGTPRLWLGVAGDCGLGARVQYWQLSQSNSAFDFANPLVNPADLTGFNLDNGLELYTFDAEGTYEFSFGNWCMLSSLGMRYVGSKANSFVTGTEFVDIGGGSFDTVIGTASGGTSFYGTGVTFGIQAIRPLWCKPCGSVDLFLAGRGSALTGDSTAYAAATSSVTNTGFTAVAAQQAIAISDRDNLWIGEVQAGLQWTFNFDRCYCPTRAFARTYFEYQNWDGGDNAWAAAGTVAGRAGVDQVTSLAGATGINGLDLIGFGVAAGFYW